MRKNRPQSALPATERQVEVLQPPLSRMFLFDDALHIEENPRIQQLWPVADVLSGRRPAVDFSLAVNYAIGGLDVGGYHAFNLVVHLLAALTLFGVVHRSLRGRRCQDHLGRAAPELALTIGLQFPERMPRIPTVEVGKGEFHPAFATQYWRGVLGMDEAEFGAEDHTVFATPSRIRRLV